MDLNLTPRRTPRKPVPPPLNLHNAKSTRKRPSSLSQMLNKSMVAPKSAVVSLPSSRSCSSGSSNSSRLGRVAEDITPVNTSQAPASPPISPSSSPGTVNGFEEPLTPNTDPEIPPEIPKFAIGRAHMRLPPITVVNRVNDGKETSEASGASGTTGYYLMSPGKTQDTPPPIPPKFRDILAIKTTCNICMDPDLMRLNGVEAECGHYAHHSCIKRLNDPMYETPTICSLCEKRLVFHPKSPAPNSACSISSQYSSSTFGDELLLDDCEVEPLSTRCFLQNSSENYYDVCIKITSNKNTQKSLWKHRNTVSDAQRLMENANNVLDLVPMSHLSLKEKRALFGNLRMSSTFSYEGEIQVIGHLFDNFIVLNSVGILGEEHFYSLTDLRKDSIDIFFGDHNYLIVHDRSSNCAASLLSEKAHRTPSFRLRSDPKTVTTWLAALNDSTLTFQASEKVNGKLMPSPISAGYAETHSLEAVLCLPIELVSRALPALFASMGPQDLLGLVVSANDGTFAWIEPHKLSWKYWGDIINLTEVGLSHFTEGNLPVLETAGRILNTPYPGKQQCIIVTSGITLESNILTTNTPDSQKSPINLYSIGWGNYDLYQLTELGSDTTDEKARFYHANNLEDIAQYMTAIAASEKHYRHHNTKAVITTADNVSFAGFIGQPPSAVTIHGDGSIECSVGSLMAGESKSFLLKVKVNGQGHDHNDIRGLIQCKTLSFSAATHKQFVSPCLSVRQFESPWASQIFFEKLTRMVSEQLYKCRFLPFEEIKDEIKEIVRIGQLEVKEYLQHSNSNSNPTCIGGESMVLVDMYDPVLSDLAKHKCIKQFGSGLSELKHVFASVPETEVAITGKLTEMIHLLQTQRSVVSRNILECLYFETLPMNVI